MKWLELRRHAPRDPEVDRLTPEGRVLAEDVGRGLTAQYDGLFVSSAKRAAETAAWMLRGAGHPLPQNHAIFEPFQRPDTPEELVATVREMFRLLPDGGRGLAVGHTPLIETAVQGLTGTEIEQLRECEGVLLVQDDDGDIGLERELRDLSGTG